MRITIKKALAAILLLVICLSLCPVNSFAATTQKSVKVTRGNKKYKKTMKVGDKLKIKIKNGKGKKYTYKSSNKAVVKVSKKGVVTARKAGSAKVTIKQNGSKKKCTLILRVNEKKNKKAQITTPQRTNSDDTFEGNGSDNYWSYSQPGDFEPKYTYDLRIFNEAYSDIYMLFYIKTDNPLPDGYQIEFYDADGKQLSNRHTGDTINGFGDIEAKEVGWFDEVTGEHIPGDLTVEGGYVGIYSIEAHGMITAKIYEYKSSSFEDYMNQNRKEVYSKTFYVRDYKAEKAAWMQTVIDEATTPTMSKQEKMNAITNYMYEHSVYFKNTVENGRRRYVFIAKDFGLPEWRKAKWEFDSATSPAILTKFGEMIDYPLKNMYAVYDRGTYEWQEYHSCAYSEADDVYFSFCRTADTNELDLNTIEKVNLDTFPYWL